MAEDEKKQSVSIEEYNNLKSDFDAQKSKLEKLEKIFEERQTKTLDKEGILKILGIEKAPEKPIAEVLGEKFNTLNGLVEKLQKDIEAKDAKIALSDKKQKVLELAKPYNFIDVNDVLSVIDLNNDDIEGQLKQIAQNKKHWIKQNNLGGSFSGGNEKKPNDIQTQLQEAIKKGDLTASITLKRQLYEQNKR